MFSTISWSNYGVTVLILVLVWYGFVCFKWYGSSCRRIFKGRLHGTTPDDSSEDPKNTDVFSEFTEPFDTLADARELYDKLLGAVTESRERNLSTAEFRNYIHYILEGYPYVKNSSLREKINSLMVIECSKSPPFTISLKDMDGLWEDGL